MKMSLLEMVQDILNDLESDEVNSIDDTPDSVQVAQILKTSYFELMSNREWPHLKRLMTLSHSGTPERPTHILLPENVKEMEYFAYDCTNTESNKYEMREIKFKYPDEFLRICSSRNNDTRNVRDVYDVGGTKLIIKTNSPPSYWTSFDDKYLVCDSYDSEVDDALKASKTQAMAVIMPVWETRDDFVPDLPVDAFAGFLAEAKSTAFLTAKQMMNDKAEQKAVRQARYMSRKAWRAHGGVRYPNYGRRSSK